LVETDGLAYNLEEKPQALGLDLGRRNEGRLCRASFHNLSRLREMLGMLSISVPERAAPFVTQSLVSVFEGGQCNMKVLQPRQVQYLSLLKQLAALSFQKAVMQ
jgi:hypothetical protein